MGTWKTSPQADPATLARVQALIDPWMADLQKGAYGNPKAWTAIPGHIKQRLAQSGMTLPDGYDVDMAGKVVFTNKTPWLQQAAWAAAPFAGGAAAQGLSGLLAGGSAAAASGGGAVAGGGAPAAVEGGGVVAGKTGFFGALGKFFGSPGGAQVTNLAGNLLGDRLQQNATTRAADLQAKYNQEALDYLKQQDARDYAEYLKERERDWRVDDEDRRLKDEDRRRKYGNEDIDRGRAEEDRQLKLLLGREREGRLTPFRQGAERGYQTLSSLLLNPGQSLPHAAPVGGVQRRSLSDLMRSA